MKTDENISIVSVLIKFKMLEYTLFLNERNDR